jgi:tRNA (Thr-GGU) A37 N-methylase
MSAVRVLGISDNILRVGEFDILEGTPLLDIKPYVSQYDSFPDQRCGWLDENRARLRSVRADDRFEISPVQATT